MEDHVEVRFTLDPDHAAKLADVAGGEAKLNDYVSAVIQNALTEEVSGDSIEQPNPDPLLLVDLYG
jgi:hypothetical protein